LASLNRPIKGVVLDVGETLVDETEYWGRFADRLGVSRLTFFATLGWLLKSGAPHQEVFARVSPETDWRSLVRDREPPFGASDLYPDAVPTIDRLRAAGLLVVVAGNQPEAGEGALTEAGVRADLVISSDRLGAAKPDPRFFVELAAAVNLDASEMVSVGDRVDNDVLPALQAGMAAIHLRRGPWGIAHIDHPGAAKATACLDSLTEVADLLAPL
jgi:HAD superfamily hydrolase (TIGR01509 family)